VAVTGDVRICVSPELAPVVVLSADATPAQFDRLRAAGAAGYLTKPIDVESLLNTVQSSTPAHATR